ncbi:MAG TPA: hypothetical protein VFR09_03640 [Alphaproteobacteria bacterium]|nr:hypothetical protein [Alphaproteobacteria bacterium]
MSDIEGVILGFIAAAFLALALIIFAQHEKISSQQTRYETLVKESAALQSENLNWKTLVERQNAKIAAMSAAQKKHAAEDAKAAQQNAKKASAYTAFSARIQNQKVSADDCAGSRMLASFYLRNRP